MPESSTPVFAVPVARTGPEPPAADAPVALEHVAPPGHKVTVCVVNTIVVDGSIPPKPSPDAEAEGLYETDVCGNPVLADDEVAVGLDAGGDELTGPVNEKAPEVDPLITGVFGVKLATPGPVLEITLFGRKLEVALDAEMLELAVLAHVGGDSTLLDPPAEKLLGRLVCGTLEAPVGVLGEFPAVEFDGIRVGLEDDGTLDALKVGILAAADVFVEATAWLPLKVVLEVLEMLPPEPKVEEVGADVVTLLELEPMILEFEDEAELGVTHGPETLIFELVDTVVEEVTSEVPEIFVVELDEDVTLEVILLLDIEGVVAPDADGLELIAGPEELEGLVTGETILLGTDEVELVAEREELDELNPDGAGGVMS
ncbi:MAG: hypothetical protein Q9157_005229 [Trypethelium eluteriae]